MFIQAFACVQFSTVLLANASYTPQPGAVWAGITKGHKLREVWEMGALMQSFHHKRYFFQVWSDCVCEHERDTVGYDSASCCFHPVISFSGDLFPLTAVRISGSECIVHFMEPFL